MKYRILRKTRLIDLPAFFLEYGTSPYEWESLVIRKLDNGIVEILEMWDGLDSDGDSYVEIPSTSDCDIDDPDFFKPQPIICRNLSFTSTMQSYSGKLYILAEELIRYIDSLDDLCLLETRTFLEKNLCSTLRSARDSFKQNGYVTFSYYLSMWYIVYADFFFKKRTEHKLLVPADLIEIIASSTVGLFDYDYELFRKDLDDSLPLSSSLYAHIPPKRTSSIESFGENNIFHDNPNSYPNLSLADPSLSPTNLDSIIDDLLKQKGLDKEPEWLQMNKEESNGYLQEPASSDINTPPLSPRMSDLLKRGSKYIIDGKWHNNDRMELAIFLKVLSNIAYRKTWKNSVRWRYIPTIPLHNGTILTRRQLIDTMNDYDETKYGGIRLCFEDLLKDPGV